MALALSDYKVLICKDQQITGFIPSRLYFTCSNSSLKRWDRLSSVSKSSYHRAILSDMIYFHFQRTVLLYTLLEWQTQALFNEKLTSKDHTSPKTKNSKMPKTQSSNAKGKNVSAKRSKVQLRNNMRNKARNIKPGTKTRKNTPCGDAGRSSGNNTGD